MTQLSFASLFAGIGGIDYGLERAGMRCAWQCELDDWCCRVLEKHYPGVPRYRDVRSVDGSAPPVDVLAGGFPCQSSSVAGKRLGAADERWLWPEFARLIRLLRPRYVLVENVPGLLIPIRASDQSGDGGERPVVGAAPVAEVLGDLATLGYDAEWDCISAAAIGAPHLRERVWIVAFLADTGGARPQGSESEPARGRPRPADGGQPVAASGGVSDAERDQLRVERHRGWKQRGESRPAEPGDDGAARPLADAKGEFGRQPERRRRRGDVQTDAESRGRDARQVPPGRGEPRRAGRIFGTRRITAAAWQPEPLVGRVADGVPRRVDRLRGLGNAVVPQVVEYVGRLIIMDAEAQQ